MIVLVTGATGRVGRRVVNNLLAAGVGVRALTRSASAARLPATVEVVQGDLTNATTLPPTLFDGVERMYLYPELKDLKQVLHRAKAAGVAHIVVLSSGQAMYDQKVPYDEKRLHGQVESVVEESGMAWTFVRPGAFMSNALAWVDSIRTENIVRMPYGDARYPHIHEADVADVATTALLETGHRGAKYVITGPASITPREQTQWLGEALGREIRFHEMSREEFHALWGKHLSYEEIELELWIYAKYVQKPPTLRHVVEQVTGKAGRTFAEWAIEHADAFR
jgi:uncharacterized protein YbjT (DUF2867 family)